MNLNETEQKVLDEMNLQDHFNERPSFCVEDIFVDGLSQNQIKGYISDFLKKNIIIECEFPNNIMGYQVLEQFIK